MKWTKTILAIIVVGLLTIIGTWLFFLDYMTSVYPPIEEYKFEGTEKELLENLKFPENLANTTITDTTGQFPTDYNVYFKIIDVDSCAYHMKYSIDNRKRVQIDLIGVFDLTINEGGYSNSKEEIISELKDKFERTLIEKIKTTTNNR
ncbi:hypothetical protein GYB29_05725 [bacterium]|nr:hypothetical protein [Balneola sp.]MBR9917177.1 hypothetical protein [bacterium]